MSVVVAGILALSGAAPALAADFTWSGAGSSFPRAWSEGADWVGGTAPSGSVGTLTFPVVSSCPGNTCYVSSNDLSGLSASAISINDFPAGYQLSGNAVTLGSGGLTATSSVASSGASPSIAFPITLGAPQTWSLSNGSGAPPGDLALLGNVTGAADPLTISIGGQSSLFVGADIEVGQTALTGTDSARTGNMSLLNGLVAVGAGRTGSLDATDGSSVSLTDLGLSSVDGTVGSLTTHGADVQVGQAQGSAGGLVVDGGVTFDSATFTDFQIAGSGTVAGTDYGQLAASGTVTPGDAAIDLTAGTPAHCLTLTAGSVYTLVTTSGSVSGTFFGGDGATASIGVPTGCPPPSVQAQINYSANSVTATLVANSGAPTNVSAPTITGTPTEGQMLTEHHGTWNGSPTSFSYQWEDCDSSGSSCADIPGATSQTYTLTESDIGDTIRVREIAGNASGTSAPATSDPTAVVAPLAPTNISPPTISGGAMSGQTLTENHGSWHNDPTSYTYQWELCDSSGSTCGPITGETRQTYAVRPTDVGHTIVVQETAVNSAGPSQAVASSPTAVVTNGFVWTGSGGSDHSWSNGSNWEGIPPAGSVPSLTFPASACAPPACVATDDIAGLSTGNLVIESKFASSFVGSWDISGSTPLALSSGLATTFANSNSAGSSFGAVSIDVPLTLTAPNTWSLANPQMTIGGDVSGSSNALTLNFDTPFADAFVDIAGASVEVGPVSTTSSQTGCCIGAGWTGIELGPGQSGDLNGTDGNSISLGGGTSIGGNGSLGPLTVARNAAIGWPSASFPEQLAVHGVLTLDPQSTAVFELGAGAQTVTATGTASIDGSYLQLMSSDCHPTSGMVYTLISARGVSGLFAYPPVTPGGGTPSSGPIADGAIVQAFGSCPTPPSYEINYTGTEVTATALVPPTVETGSATALSQTTASLAGSVNPNGLAVTDCHFEYGTTTAYTSSVPCGQSAGSGISPVAVSAQATNLAPGTTYHFRVVASNIAGTSTGQDVTFATPAPGSGSTGSPPGSGSTGSSPPTGSSGCGSTSDPDLATALAALLCQSVTVEEEITTHLVTIEQTLGNLPHAFQSQIGTTTIWVIPASATLAAKDERTLENEYKLIQEYLDALTKGLQDKAAEKIAQKILGGEIPCAAGAWKDIMDAANSDVEAGSHLADATETLHDLATGSINVIGFTQVPGYDALAVNDDIEKLTSLADALKKDADGCFKTGENLVAVLVGEFGDAATQITDDRDKVQNAFSEDLSLVPETGLQLASPLPGEPDLPITVTSLAPITVPALPGVTVMPRSGLGTIGIGIGPAGAGAAAAGHAVRAGQTLRLSGAGFAPRARIEIVLSNALGRAIVTANSRGDFTTRFKIPLGAASGRQQLSAIGRAPGGSLRTLAVTIGVRGSGHQDCVGTISGAIRGGLRVRPHIPCMLVHARVFGNVEVGRGAVFEADSSTIHGNIQASRPGAFTLCGDRVYGHVSVHHSALPVLIGGVYSPLCARTIIRPPHAKHR